MKPLELITLLAFLFVSPGASAQIQNYVNMKVMVIWDTDVDTTGFEKISTGGKIKPVTSNNLHLRVMVIGNNSQILQEKLLDSTGNANFQVLAYSITDSSRLYKEFAAYSIRVTGDLIEEKTVEGVRPGMGDSTVMVYIRPKETKEVKPDRRLVSVSSLKASEKAQKEFKKGNEAFAKNELEQAQKHFQKALEIYPEYEDAHNGLGMVFLKSNDVKAAAPSFQKALEINPQSDIALTNLARVAISEKDFELAYKHLHQAISISPLAPQTLSLLCQIGVLVGKYEEVVRNARTLHTLPHANMALAHFAAGDSLMRLNRPEEALVEYNLFLSEDPKSRLAPRASESIKEIERITGGGTRSR